MALVSFEVVGSVAVLTLNRPDKRNAVNGALAAGLESALDRFEADPDLRVGLLCARSTDPPVFCSGHDLTSIGSPQDSSITDKGGFAGLVERRRQKPLIAVVDGLASSGGLEIVLACDIVVASNRAQFALAETRWGLIPGGGGLFRLQRVVGRMIAMDMVLSGEPISAERAYEIGLVSRLCPAETLRAEALRLAGLIAMHGPTAIVAARAGVAALEASVSDDAAWTLTREMLWHITATQDAAEGIRAFAERRAPLWTGR